MVKKQTTFNWTTWPLYRPTDPASSRTAAEGMVESGKLGRHEWCVMNILKHFNGSTCGEIASYSMELDYEATHKRMKGLELKNLIVRGAIRKCTVRGTRMTTWYIKDGIAPRTGQEV